MTPFIISAGATWLAADASLQIVSISAKRDHMGAFWFFFILAGALRVSTVFFLVEAMK